ncbi:molybdopterin-guanine dinucleotide biosynthesis protein a : Molybdenum cofactor guanylyltransferase OS=Sorangium cellulosum (strain So ce56) GN=mobA PE=3 SV=1: NTP_transf_3 [Gemmataceae bacterium]|nr:molybdopterin-guanine dinucleotide biosynthesis protein a : Molybdenum cofactor guanylyltransferase OS=Sorangium cellulosum (strain So ce56) GN=mobA PE=3 SV=1: NTP_transf_3 [Gemmataceae bacterium]VTU00774.1 molybdopterin-guanine dinucleotide biosynthesis protein a : Molybdenum cofactor guanylyltransferase OS=Sorangium cellulosum (strain So ce56) GN=mobA PE=3 SV=1: NTP_transf_3 [Gemmataceae bacterium]
MRVAGIVLCGGRSSRMGRPKAWLPFGGETLLQRTVRTLSEAVHPVIVVAAPGQDVPPLPTTVRIVRDEVKDRGPLGGLAAGLAALEGLADAAYLSACDVPFLTPAFVRRVIELLGDADIAVPHIGDHFHPLAAAYRLSVLPHVRELLAADRLRVAKLFDAVPVRLIESDGLAGADPEFRALLNVNTPEEYRAALRDAGERPG